MKTVEKYLRLRKEKMERFEPLDPLCDFCGGVRRESKYHPGTCAKCGAKLPKIYGFIFGLPVYNPNDCKEFLNSSYFKMY